MAESPQSQAELERTLRLMDVADEIRRQHRRVQKHLAQSDRERIKAHLLERYRAMGHEADPALLDEAIDTVLTQQHRFRPPAPGFSLRLATLYVRRGRIARRVGLPLLGLLLLLGVGVVGTQRARDASVSRREQAVETSVARLYRKAQELRSRAEKLESDPALELLSPADRSRLDDVAAGVTGRLESATAFLGTYAPRGAVREAITPDNHQEVEAKAGTVGTALDDAEESLAEAETLLREEGESARLLGLAQQHVAAIESVAREDAAQDRAKALAGDAQRHAASGNVEGLRAAVDALADLEHTLNLEYRLVVIRGRERDRVRHYLIVQALDPDGRPVSVRIRNEETNRLEEMTEWGERVPKHVYDRVAEDYREDNVINDNFFGEKKRGYLEPERRYGSLGRITRY